MAIQNSTLRNRTPNWDSKKRYKVNESVNYNGSTWQNTTGTNSEPGVGSDWINISRVFTLESKELLTVITPSGNVTNSTAETILYTWFVPGGTFNPIDRFKIEEFVCASNGTLNATAFGRIRFNTTNDLPTTNDKLFATITFSNNTTDRFFNAERRVRFINGKIRGFFNLAGSFTDKVSSNYTSNDYNTNVGMWWFFTIQNGSLLDSTYMDSLIIKK